MKVLQAVIAAAVTWAVHRAAAATALRVQKAAPVQAQTEVKVNQGNNLECA
jgi:trehalose utilization protein